MKTPTDKAIEDKFQSLLEMGLATLQRCGWDGREFQTFPNLLEYQRLLTQAANLIERVCGRRGAHYEAINQLVPHHQRASNLPKVIGILKAAQADYADGFLAELRYLVRADLRSEEHTSELQSLRHLV